MIRFAVALWKYWVCKYSIRFEVIKLKLLCETLKNEKWKILAWYPHKMQWYHQQNPKCSDWHWTNFQMQVALDYRNVILLKLLNQTKTLLTVNDN